MKKEKFDSIKTLKRMGIVPRTRHYEQMVSMSKWIFIVGFVTVILAMNTGCASIETTAYGPYVDQILTADTPGATRINIKKVNYTKLRRPIHPIDIVD